MRLFGVRAAYDRTRIDFVEEEIILKGTKEINVSSLPFIGKQAFNTNYPNITKSIAAKSASYNSILYRIGDCILLRPQEFASIIAIYKCISTIFLQCQLCSTVEYDEHIQAFHIIKLPKYIFVTVNDLHDHHRLPTYLIQKHEIIVPKYFYCVSLKMNLFL